MRRPGPARVSWGEGAPSRPAPQLLTQPSRARSGQEAGAGTAGVGRPGHPERRGRGTTQQREEGETKGRSTGPPALLAQRQTGFHISVSRFCDRLNLSCFPYTLYTLLWCSRLEHLLGSTRYSGTRQYPALLW